MKCCICKKEFRGYGNNPDGAMWRNASGEIVAPEFGPEDRCCDDCNDKFVIPGRFYRIQNRK